MDEIRLEPCTLREWRPGDEASLARHANNHKVWINMCDVFPHPYTLDDARWWIATGSVAEGLVNWAIVVAGQAIGGIGLMPKDDVERRTAGVGYWLGEPYWGRGIATAALRAVTDWAFANLDVVRLEAGVFEWNPASARVLEKAGFHLEARNRQAVTKDGRTIDRLLYARLRAPSAP